MHIAVVPLESFDQFTSLCIPELNLVIGISDQQFTAGWRKADGRDVNITFDVEQNLS